MLYAPAALGFVALCALAVAFAPTRSAKRPAEAGSGVVTATNVALVKGPPGVEMRVPENVEVHPPKIWKNANLTGCAAWVRRYPHASWLHEERLAAFKAAQPKVNESSVPRIRWKAVEKPFTSGEFLLQLFGKGYKGFYVESGAFDGCNSHTVHLELDGWNGMLVEPNSAEFAKVKETRRRAWMVHAAIALGPKPHVESLMMEGLFGGLENFVDMARLHGLTIRNHQNKPKTSGRRENVTCVPFHALMGLAGKQRPDFWVLDTEGSEMFILDAVLKASPSPAKIIMVEHSNKPFNQGAIWVILGKVGYHRFYMDKDDDWYVHKDFCREFGNKCYEYDKYIPPDPPKIRKRFKPGGKIYAKNAR